MKRSAPDSQVPGADQKMKKVKEEAEEKEEESGLMNLDENLLYEILKHMDARTLAMASCVSKLWLKTAKDERLWELICTRHWANIGYGTQQLRSVVLPLGGFRRLHSLCLWPLSKPQAASASIINSKPHARWGKDEQLRNHFVFLRRTGGGCKKKEHLDPMDKACLLELRRWYGKSNFQF